MDILLYNSTTFTPAAPGQPPSVWADSIQMFYSDVLNDAGIASNKWDWFDTIPTIEDLYLYRMVIIDDVDWYGEISQTTQEAFLNYLDIGGDMWIIGRKSFLNSASYDSLYIYEDNPVTEPLPFSYLGLEAGYFPPISAPAEFIGANRYAGVNTAFPDISVDTLKIQGLVGNFDYAMPQVEFSILTPGTEALYRFNAINPGAIGTFHDFPVAVRRETDTYKTSYFSFPLFLMEYDGAAQIFNVMLDWFLEE
jgi:hypothetical protein